jgi:hypothetical protein
MQAVLSGTALLFVLKSDKLCISRIADTAIAEFETNCFFGNGEINVTHLA